MRTLRVILESRLGKFRLVRRHYVARTTMSLQFAISTPWTFTNSFKIYRYCGYTPSEALLSIDEHCCFCLGSVVFVNIDH